MKGRITSYTNLLCEFIITSDKAFFDNIGEEETKRYFKTAYDFVTQYQNLGEDFIISAKIHMDESAPHMHIVFVPVIHKLDIKSGNQIHKIACSEYWKGKDSYKKLQDSFYKYITDKGFKLERGKSNNAEHLSTEKLKQVTGYDNIKYELEYKTTPTLNTENFSVILAQNKDLVEYNNKLKLYLSKSFKIIEQIDELKQNNINLKQEHGKLKKQNCYLKNYINNTFKVVECLFDFPMDMLKNVVDNFIKSNER